MCLEAKVMESLYFLLEECCSTIQLLLFLHGRCLCIAPAKMSILLGPLSDRTGRGHFLQICEVYVQNCGFEFWHKSRIQFVLHTAKLIFFKEIILIRFALKAYQTCMY